MLAGELQGSVAIPADMTKTDEIAGMVAETEEFRLNIIVLYRNIEGSQYSLERKWM